MVFSGEVCWFGKEWGETEGNRKCSVVWCAGLVQGRGRHREM
jgi:hypothetical protein